MRNGMARKYRKAGILDRQCKWYPVCPMKAFYEERHIDARYVELYCKGDWENCVRYQMEERGEFHPDWMLPDGRIDERLHKIWTGVSP